ncbi:hypothetical protein Drorol1_Dr00011824, partial [Drosera rotundifolia]
MLIVASYNINVGGRFSGDIALQIALGNHQEAMSWYLVFMYPQASYRLNVHGKCPLYMAMKGKCWDLAKYMLMTEPIRGEAAVGLLQRKSIVHAAIISQNKGDFPWSSSPPRHLSPPPVPSLHFYHLSKTL